MSSLTRRGVLLGGAAYLGHLGLGALAGCDATTGGRIVNLRTQVQVHEATLDGFTNRHGWRVELVAAQLARGRLEFYTGDAPVTALVTEALVGSAHAHPGHYAEGEILGEVLGAGVIDLLAGVSELPSGRGVSGRLGSAHLTFEPTAMNGNAVVVEGVATRDGDMRPFIARAAHADVTSHHDAPEVWGCPFEGDLELENDGVITLTVRPEIWLDDVRFEMHGVREDGQPLALDPLLEPHDAFIEGVRDHEAYVFAYEASV